MMAKLYGRDYELRLLKDLYLKKTASFVVIKGRRRIGKSRLIEAFAEGEQHYFFEGVRPQEATTAESQRQHFADQLAMHFGFKGNPESWLELLLFLADKTKRGRIIISLDEISWMGSKDPDFLGVLKLVWDNHFKKNPKLILIVCGSVSIWIKENIISDTGFVGRLSLKMTLKALPIQYCNAFLKNKHDHLSAYEKLKFLSITGCVPKYLEEWRHGLTAEQNIAQMCFDENGILFSEFDEIFSDALDSRAEIYKDIVCVLINAALSREEISTQLKKYSGGDISAYLENLVEAGFVQRDYTWSLQTKTLGKLSRYRLSDNYMRFYLKYIEPNKSRIVNGGFKGMSLDSLPAWATMLGLQFENLILSNRQAIWQCLRLQPEDVVMGGAYFQRKTQRQKGCQVDYMIQTRTNVLYVCEVRFSRNRLDHSIVTEMQEKIKTIKIPKNFSCLPVLIHVNGVTDSVVDEAYFIGIVDFADLFNEE